MTRTGIGSLTLDAPTIMACESNTVRHALGRVPGVRDVFVNLAFDRVMVQYDAAMLDAPRLVRTLERLGLKRAAAQAAIALGTDATSTRPH